MLNFMIFCKKVSLNLVSLMSMAVFIQIISLGRKRMALERVILNLKHLTPYLEKKHFKMETIRDAILMMRPGCYFGSIDFKHAFCSVRVRQADRKFLRFIWVNKHYQSTCPLQVLGPTSRIFTKLLKPVFAHLRELGLEISGYIDDSITCTVHDNVEDYVKHITCCSLVWQTGLHYKWSAHPPLPSPFFLSFSSDLIYCLSMQTLSPLNTDTGDFPITPSHFVPPYTLLIHKIIIKTSLDKFVQLYNLESLSSLT